MSVPSVALVSVLFICTNHWLNTRVVTKGYGLNRYNEPYYPDTPTNLHRIIFDHLVSLYPAPNGVKTDDSGRKEGKHGYINGGQGATGKIQ